MKAVSFITDNGASKAAELAGRLPDSEIVDLRGKGRLRPWVEAHFHRYDGHVFIMSIGIVYRTIAPCITNKYEDPAVVVVDDARRYAIAALSGHEGGANVLAWQTAGILGCEPVITTASDTNKKITLGVGCRRGAAAAAIECAVDGALADAGVSHQEIRLAASADIKRNERGLIDAFTAMKLPLIFVDSSRIRRFSGYHRESKAARRRLDLPGVSEPCALLIGRRARLILPRTIYNGVTIALAREDVEC